MTPEPMAPAPPPRWRRWRLGRWFLVVLLGVVGYCGWREYDFRAAVKEAQALGWQWRYDDPFNAIRKDWTAAFRKATWFDGTRDLVIPEAAPFEPHARLLRPLAPKTLSMAWRSELKDLSALKGLSTLRLLDLSGCTGLTNLDALKGLPALERLDLPYCTGLTNVDALKGLSTLQMLWLDGCTNLSAEAVATLQAALPNTLIAADP